MPKPCLDGISLLVVDNPRSVIREGISTKTGILQVWSWDDHVPSPWPVTLGSSKPGAAGDMGVNLSAVY